MGDRIMRLQSDEVNVKFLQLDEKSNAFITTVDVEATSLKFDR